VRRFFLTCLFSLCLLAAGWAQEASGSSRLAGLTPFEGDFTPHNFQFASGQTLPELRLHYYTFGKLQKDASGRATNAVLILHNPPELGIAEREIKKVKNGKVVLLPISDQSHGHGTHTDSPGLAGILEGAPAGEPPLTSGLTAKNSEFGGHESGHDLQSGR
jgi:hypothetical protein